MARPTKRWITGALVSLLLLFLCILLLPRAANEPPPWQDEIERADLASLRRWAGRSTVDAAERALAVVDPYGQLGPYLRLERSAAQIYFEAGEDEPSAVIELADQARDLSAAVDASLAGRRILLDPGHFGGAWSRIEHRHRELEPGSPVREGDLTWATAQLLAQRLRAAGAEVLLSRGPPPQRAFPADLEPSFVAEREAGYALAERAGSGYGLWRWLYPARIADLALRRARSELVEEERFALYRRFDLRRRAELAASFKADLLLSIHFNTMGKQRRNGVLVFIPGNFLPGELDLPATRRDAVRRVIDDTLPAAAVLAEELSLRMQAKLDLGPLPVARKQEQSIMLPIAPAAGVYARNLAVLRRSQGLAVMVEGPCVDEPEEYQRLTELVLEVDGQRYPRRVAQFSDALFEALSARSTLLYWRD